MAVGSVGMDVLQHLNRCDELAILTILTILEACE